jgi:hypothetical protein
MCCGQKRTELRNSEARDPTRSVKQVLSNNRRTQVRQTQPPPSRATERGAQHHYTAPADSFPPLSETTPLPTICVRYLQTSPVRVRGLVSGVCYEFSGSSPVQDVDARDSSSLLHTRFFRRA